MRAAISKTYMAKAADLDAREWYVVDANDLVLGRLSTKLARVLMGKHKPGYTPHLDMGDFVVVLNAEKIRVTGKKRAEKVYPYYTGWPGGLRARQFSDLQERDPGRVIKLAVQRMLPKTKLGRKMLTKLKVYRGSDHPHASQKPQPLALDRI